MQTYFSSFAFGIKEMGYKKGETIAIHTDNAHAAETLTSLVLINCSLAQLWQG